MAFVLTILSAVLVVFAALAFLEWQRPNRNHLVPRLIATMLSVGSFAWLGVSSFSRQNSSSASTEASLFTPGVSLTTADDSRILVPRFALPGISPRSPAITFLPDAASLRRRLPSLQTLHVYGDGLDPSDLPALTGLHVIFHLSAPSLAPVNDAAIQFLRCPRELPLGEPLIVQGRINGLAAGQTTKLSLTAPDGMSVEAVSTPADDRGEAAFSLRAAALPATGRFLWHLRLGNADLPIGVSITPPTLPRVLILESAPHFDAAALRHWFETASGTLLIRTQVGQDRFRYAAAHGPPPPSFNVLDTKLLAEFDLILMDDLALLALSPDERAALLAAIRDTGLGLLVLADASLSLPSDALSLLPWVIAPITADGNPTEDQSVRLRWLGQVSSTDLPIPAAPFEIHLSAHQTALLTDHQDRTLAAASPLGRGQLALTLVRETSRWQRENDPAAFADYWSHLFSHLARRSVDPGGHWTLLDGEAGPVFVDHPLRLLWSGSADHVHNPAFVTSSADTPATTLALAPDPAEPTMRHALFWPRQPGWHHVATTPGAPGLDFYVHPAGSWPVLDATRRRFATARFAETSAVPPKISTPPPIASGPTMPPGWLLAIFFLSAGYLWTERRLTL